MLAPIAAAFLLLAAEVNAQHLAPTNASSSSNSTLRGSRFNPCDPQPSLMKVPVFRCGVPSECHLRNAGAFKIG